MKKTTRTWTAQVGSVEAVTPPGALDGTPLRWPDPPTRFLAGTAGWS